MFGSTNRPPVRVGVLDVLLVAGMAAMLLSAGQSDPAPVPPDDKEQVLHVHLTGDITWTDAAPQCYHSQNGKCQHCRTKGSCTFKIDADVVRDPGGSRLTFLPRGNARATADWEHIVFCPIGGEGEHYTVNKTWNLLAPKEAAEQGLPAAPHAEVGEIELHTIMWGTGLASLGIQPTPDLLIRHQKDVDYVLHGYMFSVAKGFPRPRQVGISYDLIVATAPEKASGVMSWRMQNISLAQADTTLHIPQIVDSVDLKGQGPFLPKTDPKYCPRSQINYRVAWTIGGPKPKVEMISPQQGAEFVFGRQKAKEAVIEAEARARPDYDPKIQPWNSDPVEGSRLEIKNRDGGATGPLVTIRYKDLPEGNEFGEKKISADDADPVTVKLFFRKNEKDNPDGTVANWYYDWKQGAVPGLEEFRYENDDSRYGYFDPQTGSLRICPLAGWPEPAYSIQPYSFSEPPLVRVLLQAGKLSFPRKTSIEACHATVLHEKRHKYFYELNPTGWGDTDGDGLPDWLEQASAVRLDPDDPDTHDIAHQLDYLAYRAYGDQELLCRLEELANAPDKNQDWAYPGSQSSAPDKDRPNPARKP